MICIKSGYKITDISNALDISRSTCYLYKNELPANTKREKTQKQVKKEEEDKMIADKIKERQKDRPRWGYRRCWAWLWHRENIHVNKKRIYRVMKENNLLQTKQKHLANRTPLKSKPRPTKKNEWWGTDMTKVLVQGVGWLYFVVVIDWHTKKIIGYKIDLRSRSAEWEEALEMAVNNECPNGSREYNVNLMSDNGSQPTSRAYSKTCATLGIEQAFTSYNNPKGNADTERVFRTFKEDCAWLYEWESFSEAKAAIEKWIFEYNNSYVHSSLGYISPVEFEQSLIQAA